MPLLGKLIMAGREQRATGTVCPESPAPRASISDLPKFPTIYSSYFELVWSTARRLGVPSDAMDDVVQEVFIVIHNKLDTLERPEALRSWIYGITRRTVSAYHRSQRARIPLSIQAGIEREAVSHAPTPLAHTETSAELRMLLQLLDELDEPKREVFALVEIEELSVPQVAELLDIPLNTAYSRLRAARQAFDVALTRYEARAGKREVP
jgi:RNA polymerase sigma-70 factor (ECF subfamily)